MVEAIVREQIELTISCRNLISMDTFSKSDPFIKVHIITGGEEKYLGRSETFQNNDCPNFEKKFIFDFIFEEQQILKIQVSDDDSMNSDDFIGSASISVGEIIGANDSVLIQDLRTKKDEDIAGKIIIKADKVPVTSKQVLMQWFLFFFRNIFYKRAGINQEDVEEGFWNKSDPFLRVSRKNGEDWEQIHQTGYVLDNLNPIWRPFWISIEKLCQMDYHKEFKLAVFDWQQDGQHKLLGEVITNMNEILTNGTAEFQLMLAENKAGTLKLLSVKEIHEPSFLDFMIGNTQLNLMVAIDYTASNGQPGEPGSLHAISADGTLNQYQMAIKEVGKILLNYDTDKKIPVFGFGGIPEGKEQVSHCYPLTGDMENYQVNEINGILEVYKKAVETWSFSGPTQFTPIIKQGMHFAKCLKEQGAYPLLLILTDGDIDDMEETIKHLAESANLPLSVIIIGIGDEDFESMQVLDGDEGLKGYGKLYRDLVQFTKFKKFEGNMKALVQKVLFELPKQILDYMRRTGQEPKPRKEINLADIQV